MIVRPAPGLQVRHPASHQRIPETGIEVSDTDTYWARRLLAGDVIEVKPAVEPVLADEKKE